MPSVHIMTRNVKVFYAVYVGVAVVDIGVSVGVDDVVVVVGVPLTGCCWWYCLFACRFQLLVCTENFLIDVLGVGTHLSCLCLSGRVDKDNSVC